MPLLFEQTDFQQSSVSCNHCGMPLRHVAIDVTANTAQCGFCGTLYAVTDFIRLDFDLEDPPAGTAFLHTADAFSASAGTRPKGVWLKLPVLALFAASLLSKYVLHSASPDIPALLNYAFEAIGVIFVLLLAISSAMDVAGRVVVQRNGDDGSVFEGVGTLGWTRRFQWSALQSVVETVDSSWLYARRPPRVIALNFSTGPRKHLRFGTLLSNERRWFLLALLRAQTAGSGQRRS